MILPSFAFFMFLLAVCVFVNLLPFSWWKKIVLLGANVLFYASYQPMDLIYLFSVILYSYSIAFLLNEKKSRVLLALAIIPILFGLCFFKTSFLFFDEVNLIAPLGISFFTFKVVGYLADVYQSVCEVEPSFLNYALYVSFFPQISSGPIQKASEFLEKLKSKPKASHHLLHHGFLLVFFGLFEKIVISERLYQVVSNCFSDMSQCTPSLALIGMVAYSFQIYADFDSYSNLAIGMSELCGIECCKNFHAPYFAKNIKEFWERWHISLSTWLKEYVYFPLGGSRKGTLRKMINLFVVFLVSGLWHGTTWNFLLWGVLNGLLRVVYDVLNTFIFSKIQIRFHPLKWLLSGCSILLNFALVTCLWVFFRTNSMDEIRQIFTLLAQFDVNQFRFSIHQMADNEAMVTFIMTVLLVICDLMRHLGFTLHHFRKLFFPVRWAVYAAMIVLMIVFAVYGPGYDPSKFIYIQF